MFIMFKPGDFVEFNFWSSYLAPSAYEDENGNIKWIELQPGDIGMIICADEKCNQRNDDTVVVVFSRVNKVLRVHDNQLKIKQS